MPEPICGAELHLDPADGRSTRVHAICTQPPGHELARWDQYFLTHPSELDGIMPATPHEARITWPSTPDPAYIQHNIETLSQIGGLYDLVAARVEQDHAELLAKWRLDTGAKSLVVLLADRDHRSEHPQTHTEQEPS